MNYLSKTVPSHKKTIRFHWCKKEWMQMSQKFRDIRSKSRNPMNSCFWCGHKFVDGEMMALAAPVKSLNKVLCQDCADDLLKNFEQEKGEGDGAKV